MLRSNIGPHCQQFLTTFTFNLKLDHTARSETEKVTSLCFNLTLESNSDHTSFIANWPVLLSLQEWKRPQGTSVMKDQDKLAGIFLLAQNDCSDDHFYDSVPPLNGCFIILCVIVMFCLDLQLITYMCQIFHVTHCTIFPNNFVVSLVLEIVIMV